MSTDKTFSKTRSINQWQKDASQCWEESHEIRGRSQKELFNFKDICLEETETDGKCDKMLTVANTK